MKTLFVSIASAALAVGLAASAQAMPIAPLGASRAASAGTPAIEKARIVCTYHRCYRTGYYRPYYYRPYGYYRPYYYGPHVGVGIGPFGVGIY